MTHFLLMHAPEIGTAAFIATCSFTFVLLLDLILND